MLCIDVTQHHIDQGRSGEYDACPVARALWDLGYREVRVEEDFISITSGRRHLKYKTPRSMRLFIDDFDNFRPVKPTVFTVPLF